MSLSKARRNGELLRSVFFFELMLKPQLRAAKPVAGTDRKVRSGKLNGYYTQDLIRKYRALELENKNFVDQSESMSFKLSK